MTEVNQQLLAASHNGVVEAIDRAISDGADPDHVDDNGVTPLVAAAYNGQIDSVEHLLNYGANPNLGVDPPLCCAASKGYLEIVRLLVAHKATDVNARNHNNFTALFDAAEQGYTKMVLTLLENGANLNSIGSYSITPLHMAAQNGHIAIAALLLKHGANPNIVSTQGETAKDSAQRKEHWNIVELLTQYATVAPSGNRSSGVREAQVVEYQNHQVLDVAWDDDCIRYAYQQRCNCGRFWTMKRYRRNSGTDVIECHCPECNLIQEYAFRPQKIHASVSELIQQNRQYVRT